MRRTATSGPAVGSNEYGSAAALADEPGSGVVAHRTPVNLSTGGASAAQVGVLAWALVLVGAWLALDPRTPDMAAQVYRAQLFAQQGLALWDEHWYAGHTLLGYSLLSPPAGALLGVRALGAICVLASTMLFERLVRSLYGAAAAWGAALFAVSAVGDVWSGRVTFAMGVTLAVGAALALRHDRLRWAALLAGLCAAASPAAGALLGMVALTVALSERSMRALVAMALPAAVVVGVLVGLFPEGGYEPFPFLSFCVTALVTVAFMLALPHGSRGLRMGGGLYLLACVTCVLVRTPMGSNIERYGVLLAGPLLLCAHLARPRARRTGADGRRLLSVVALTAVLLSTVWVVWGPVRETAAVAGSEATSASYYLPVERFLAAHAHGPVRVEVPLTRSHWEAALLAPTVSLARGWEKQMDTRYDGALLRSGLTAGAYEDWLDEQAVSYVALPDARLDPSSAQEGRLIERGVPYLREVFTSEHWRIYRVLGASPLLSGPGRLVALGHDSFSLRALHAGSFLARIHYTRYWTLTHGRGCVTEGPKGWTEIRLDGAGSATVAARFSLTGALGLGGGCAHTAGALVPGAAGPGSGTGAGAGGGNAAAEPGNVAGGPYRWLVRTTGAQPSIAAENGARGTSGWRLPGPRLLLGGEGRGAVEGYVAEQAISPGETQRVYVSAPGARWVRLDVYRMGWYGGKGGRLVLRSGRLRAVRQPACGHRWATGLTECDWHATLTFAVPWALASGVYIVKLRASTGAVRDCMFVVRSTVRPKLLVQIPTATYEAYNAWGGDSLYPGGGSRVGVTGTDQGVEVSYDRPYDSQTGAGQFFMREVAMVRFLERYGYPVGYTTSESVDADPAQVDGTRALMDVGHSEYWSEREERAFAQARDGGTSLIFVSSDTMAWRVRFARATAASSQRGARDHRMVAYKEFAGADPDKAHPTGLFPGGGAQLMGSAYNGCITPRVAQLGPPVYRYYAWRPSPSLQPSWLFAGTGVTAATSIPGVVGYELDERTAASPAATHVIGGAMGVPCQSESEPSPVRGTATQSTLYTAPSGALVFATGTLGWEYALYPVPQASPDAPAAADGRVVRITRNLLGRVLGGGG
jgi:hypothetical protein